MVVFFSSRFYDCNWLHNTIPMALMDTSNCTLLLFVVAGTVEMLEFRIVEVHTLAAVVVHTSAFPLVVALVALFVVVVVALVYCKFFLRTTICFFSTARMHMHALLIVLLFC